MFSATQLSMIGLKVSGDVAGLTIYTDRYGRKVAYHAAPPTKPLTEWQLAWQRNLRVGMILWRRLTPYDRLEYRRACDAASLCMLGHNLWLHVYLAGDYGILAALNRQYGLHLVAPPKL